MGVSGPTPEFKRNVVALLIDGYGWQDLAVDYNLDAGTLLDWVCEHVRTFANYYQGASVDPAQFESESDYEGDHGTRQCAP